MDNIQLLGVITLGLCRKAIEGDPFAVWRACRNAPQPSLIGETSNLSRRHIDSVDVAIFVMKICLGRWVAIENYCLIVRRPTPSYVLKAIPPKAHTPVTRCDLPWLTTRSRHDK